MSLELLGRVHKELSITGSAFYETILAISERVNRKVQIIRLHWQASLLLERIDQVTGEAGQQVVDQVSRRFLTRSPSDATFSALDALLNGSVARIQELKQSLARIDARIRELKLEAVHHDLLQLQRDLSVRCAALERVTISRDAPAVGQSVRVAPPSPSVHIAAILRGPFLLSPHTDVVFRPDDIVVLIGIQSELDHVIPWFTESRVVKMAASTPA